MKKQQGINRPKSILYRVIMAIMAVCVPVAAYFCDLIYYVTKSDLFALLAKLQGNTQDVGEPEDSWSLHRVVTELLPTFKGGTFDGAKLQNVIAPIRGALIAFAVFFVLAVVIAVVIFFFSCFSRGKLVPLCIAGGGLLSMIGLRIAFSYVAGPLLDGTVSLSNLTGSGLLSSLLSMVATLSIFQLSTGYFLMLFLYIGMIMWAGANLLVDAGEKAQKKPQKVY